MVLSFYFMRPLFEFTAKLRKMFGCSTDLALYSNVKGQLQPVDFTMNRAEPVCVSVKPGLLLSALPTAQIQHKIHFTDVFVSDLTQV